MRNVIFVIALLCLASAGSYQLGSVRLDGSATGKVLGLFESTTGWGFDFSLDNIPKLIDSDSVELGAIMPMRLAAKGSNDLNSAGKITLYTVPEGRTYVVTMVACYAPSAGVTTAEVSFGDDVNATNFNAGVSFVGLDTTEVVYILPASGDIKTAYTATGTFGMKPTVQEGSTRTVTCAVFGFPD